MFIRFSGRYILVERERNPVTTREAHRRQSTAMRATVATPLNRWEGYYRARLLHVQDSCLPMFKTYLADKFMIVCTTSSDEVARPYLTCFTRIGQDSISIN